MKALNNSDIIAFLYSRAKVFFSISYKTCIIRTIFYFSMMYINSLKREFALIVFYDYGINFFFFFFF